MNWLYNSITIGDAALITLISVLLALLLMCYLMDLPLYYYEYDRKEFVVTARLHRHEVTHND